MDKILHNEKGYLLTRKKSVSDDAWANYSVVGYLEKKKKPLREIVKFAVTISIQRPFYPGTSSSLASDWSLGETLSEIETILKNVLLYGCLSSGMELQILG